MGMRHLKQLGDSFTIAIPPDEKGLTGRECPNPECLGYFKIEFGTGLEGEDLPCHCPYCGHTESQDHFWTTEQIEYTQSVALNKINQALKKDLQAWDRDLRRRTRGGFIQLRLDYKGTSHPIHYYQEKQLETEVVCENCTLHYAIYGVFGYCPDCGIHNSLQILNKNFELARKEIGLAATMEDSDLSAYLVADALKNAVSAFDGFGREICRVHAAKATDPNKAKNLSFQNLVRVNDRVQQLFGFSIAASLDVDDWEFTCRCFQKRHLLAHQMGVIDQEYIDKTHDPQAIIGRKVSITSSEVQMLMQHLETLGSYLITQLK